MADLARGDAGPGAGFGMGDAFPEMRAWLSGRMGDIAEAVRATLADALEAPTRFGQAGDLLTGNGDLGSAGKVLGSALAALVAAVILALLLRLLLRPLRRRLLAAHPSSMRHAVEIAGRALLIDLAPPLAYLATGLALDRLLFGAAGLVFAGTEVFAMTNSALIINSAIAWICIAVLSVPLSTERADLRLVPLDDREARRAQRFLDRVVILGAGSFILAESLYLLWFGPGVPKLLLIASAAAIGVLCLGELAHLKPWLRGFMSFWHKLAVLSVFGLALTWAIGLLLDDRPPFGRVLGTLGVLAAMPILDGIARRILQRLKRHLLSRSPTSRTIYVPREGDAAEELHAVEKPLEPGERVAAEAEHDRALDAFLAVIHEGFCILLGILALILLGKTWSLDLVGAMGSAGVRTFLGMVVDAGVTLLVGWYVWRFFETGLRLRLSREGGGTESRARTLQPLLSSIGKGVIGAIALMGALSALGVNIAPLIASAGVVGIAIGFGAQTLVKDLFSGVFFLIEDVFRIGEYIEASSAKGTVEKITFRTVALRHQNGPLHYVPYGLLGSVRNNSRDWVIDKFELPLPVDVSSELVRKMVKKIGQEMLADPALAKVTMMPLKAKLNRIVPGAKIFRCKVQTPPGMQFEVRSEAYRRIEAAFAEAGIRFAETTPQVTVHNTLAAAEASEPGAARAAE